ncbi:GGDEF domain-containing protein [Vibrio sp. SCSIO 43135]|nr:diguanylate cyclase [Vibrio sp. SCSIO 43135]USD43156.1 GGDEF domain-containing protein [Vibrio sp. SCSIO 43135]
MALPKILLRFTRPYIVVLIFGVLYLAYQQFKQSEKDAYTQSQANLNTASQLITSQIEAAASKLYLLQDARQTTSFDTLATNILKGIPAYADILLVDTKDNRVHSVNGLNTAVLSAEPISWRPIRNLSPLFSVSSIYQKQSNQWVFAVRYQPKEQHEIWIEFDLLHTTQMLRGLKSLRQGYVFVVDNSSGRLIFHPDPSIIGAKSVSYRSGISELVNQGTLFGKHEYYYKNQYRVSAFNADNQLNWVFISTTDRADILSSSNQYSLSAVIIASLLLFAIIVNYLLIQLNSSLSILGHQKNEADFKQHLRSIFDRFCYHSGVQFCLYNDVEGHFTTLDYHGNSSIVHEDRELIKHYTKGDFNYRSPSSRDLLAKKLHITSRHYTIPLFDQDRLMAVVYLSSVLPTSKTVMRMIRSQAEVALCNLQLRKQMRSKDVMTNLDNKLVIREAIDEYINLEHTYFALLDIDHFKKINDQFGHKFGDSVITHTAKLMQKCFKKPTAISLARYGGEEFCILFRANDENHAYDLCDMLRHQLEHSQLTHEDQAVQFTVSIGITSATESQHSTIGRADKALYQAKGLGRNQVVLNTFQS